MEQNPGPRQRAQTSPNIPKPPPKRKLKFSCGICERAVTWSRTKPSVTCDDCNIWYHKSCLGMSSQIVQGLKPDTAWQCDRCGIPHFMDSTLFYHPEVPLANRYSVLSESDQLHDEPGSPLHTSSPKAAQNLPKDTKNTLRILVVNTRSIFKKRNTLALTTESISPDIIIATETQVTGTTTNPEFLPPGYDTISGTDRDENMSDGHGGTLLALKDEIVAEDIPVANENHIGSEISACKINMPRNQPPQIIVGVYRPPNRDVAMATYVRETIATLTQSYPTGTFWICDDLTDSTKPTRYKVRYPKSLNDLFLNMKVDLGLEQIVHVNTREKNCLDLVFTNRPSLANRTEDAVGVSEHAAILFEITATITRAKPIKRKVFLWSKSNLTETKAEATRLTSSVLHTFSTDSPVEEIWQSHKTGLKSLVNKHVPSKMSSTRHPA